MTPSSALSKMVSWLRYWLLSDNCRSIKADLYNIEETNEGPCRKKRLAFSLQSNLGYKYETNMYLSLPIHSISQIMTLTFKLATQFSRTTHVLPCNFEIPPCKTKLDMSCFYCSQ